MNPLPVGKLDHSLLASLLKRYSEKLPSSVLYGPGIGLDAAVLQIGNQQFVSTTDPITFASDRIGWYAVEINANDVAVMGATPAWMQVCLLLPPSDENQVDTIFKDLHQAAHARQIAIIGGHTEIMSELDRPLIIASMAGLATRTPNARDIQPGDHLIVTQGVAIEGTAILARELPLSYFEKCLQDTTVSGIESDGDLISVIQSAANFLDSPGISVVKAAEIAVACHATALHDPTEGGLLTGIWEMADAAQQGVEVHIDKVPVFPESESLCDLCGINVLRTLASGALLIAISPQHTDELLETLQQHSIPATTIGHFTDQDRICIRSEERFLLHPSAQDPLATVFQTNLS